MQQDLQVFVKKLENYLEEIDLDFYKEYQNEDIVKLLQQCIETIDDVDQRSVIQQLSQKYKNNQYFIQLQEKYQQNIPNQIDFKEQYEQFKQHQDQNRLINLFSFDTFWQLGLLPQQIRPIVKILEPLDAKIFFYLIEIAESSINRIQQVSQFLMLKRLLEIKYNCLNIELEQVIGSMLINQICELENFIEIMKQSDSIEFQKAVQIMQEKQKNPNQQVLFSTQFKTLFELFAPNQEKENLSQNLDSYIKKTLSIVSDNLNFELIQIELEEFIRKDGNFDEFYFKVIVYYWGQFCYYFIQNKTIIMKRLDHKVKLINVFWNNKLGKSSIPSYFFDRFIFFIEQPSFPQIDELTQFKQNQQQIKQSIIQTFKNGQPQNRDLQNRDLWNEVQQLTYYSLNQIFTENYHFRLLIQILWRNTNEKLNHQNFLFLFLNQEKSLLSYYKYLLTMKFVTNYLSQDLLTLQLIKIQSQSINSNQNSLWQKPLNYFRVYQITEIILSRKQLYLEYPQKSNIDLESFNISLAEQTNQQKNELIEQWLVKLNDDEAFKNLISFFFNIIKRGESAETFTTMIQEAFQRLKLPSKYLNMKALFQIFFNNSNEELKMMLTKLHSKQHPVPLLYQNLQIDKITSETDLFSINHNLFYTFPNCYTIINLSLSKKQSRYGKTTLINEVFYKEKKFEVNDSCLLNNNTIDIMFDFSFDGSRQLAVADVHGTIPFEVLKNILPLFHLWIIQINSESELEENLQSLRNLLKEVKMNPIKCIIIRNSVQYEENEPAIQLAEEKGIHVLKIQDLTKQNIDQQIINENMKKAQHFVLTKIYNCNQEGKYIVKEAQQSQDRTNFYYLLDSFSPQNIRDKIKSDTELINKLEIELNYLLSQENGFFDRGAFPIRSIEFEIKKTLTEINQLGKVKKYNSKEYSELNDKKKKLTLELRYQVPTKILKLFIKIFKTENFYITYVWFSDTVSKFNSLHYNKLRENSEKIQEEIKESIFLNEGVQKLKDLEHKQKEIERQIILKTINIENFWRELIKQILGNKDENDDLNIQNIVYQLIKKGEPFEFLDGDDLQINKEFIQQLAQQFNQRDEKILIISALGPQSSGKSTVLNRIFGCHFLTSVGRTTKGINLQLLNVKNIEYFNNTFDYILLLDTEGLQSTLQQDREFDKKITLLVLAISNIIFVIVKGDLHKDVKNLIETCIYQLSQMKESFSSLKQLIWCFNQNNEVNNVQPFKESLQGIIQNIKEIHTEEIIEYRSILNNDNIQILGFATTDQRLCNQWNQYKNNDTFSQVALQKCVDILKKYSIRLQTEIINQDKGNLQGIKNFINEISTIWESIQIMPDLMEFTELIEKRQNEIMRKELEKLWGDEKQKLENTIKLGEDLKKQIDIWGQKFQNYSYNEFYNQSQIAEKIKQTREYLKDELKIQRDKHSISNNIYKKYLDQLERLIEQEIMEYQFQIIEEIEKYKIEIFLQESINNFNSTHSIDQQQELLQASGKFEEAFKSKWECQKKEQNDKFDPLYDDFEQNLIQMFRIEKYDFVLAQQDNFKEFNYFKLHINKNDPQNNEAQLIYQNLQKKQVQSQNGFMPIPKDNKHKHLLEIFFKDITEKLTLQSNEQKTLIKLDDCFQKSKKCIVIKKELIQPYINNYFLKDLLTLINNKEIEQDITNFFSILDLLKIQYQPQNLEYLIRQISQENSIERIQQIMNPFISSLRFQMNEKICLQNEFFVHNFNLYYRSLEYDHTLYISKKMQEEDEFQEILDQLQNYVVIINDSILKPKFQVDPKYKSFLEYIAFPKTNPGFKDQFHEQFPNHFNNIMVESQNGWYLLFSRVYHIIEKSFQSDSQIAKRKDSNKVQQFSQIKNIMQSIEEEIKIFNKQFSFFGVTLRLLGERFIKYYSVLILWRFFCLSKSRRLRRLNQEDRIKEQCKQLYRLNFEKNKSQQFMIQAQTLGEELVKAFENNYYKQAREEIIKNMISQMFSSYEIIRRLDQELLINQKEKNEKIIEYLLNHKTYLNNYVYVMAKEIRQQIIQNHQFAFNKLIKQNFEYIEKSLNKLLNDLPDFKNAEDYFKNPREKEQRTYENWLHDIIFNYLVGNQSQYIEEMDEKFQKIFRVSSFRSVQINLLESQRGPCLYISQLHQLLKELKNYCYPYSSSTKIALLNFENFEVDQQFQNLRNNMLGCQAVCPLCGRKCDQNNLLDIEHIHGCRNGHQIRGLSKVYFYNKASLYTCEEIQNEDVIVVQNTNILLKWEDLKKQYIDWDFRVYEQNEQQANVIKMLNIWNGQIGKEICQQLNLPHESKQLDQRNYYNQNENIHYMLFMQDSPWINDKQWESLQMSALYVMKKVFNSMYSKLSAILFNSKVRVVLDCDEVQFPFKQLKRDISVKVNFQLALDTIIEKFNNQKNIGFEKIIIIFYTNGIFQYPQKQIQVFCEYPIDLKQQIIFRFYSLSQPDLELDKIVQKLRQSKFDVQQYMFKNPEFVKEIWAERISDLKIFQY